MLKENAKRDLRNHEAIGDDHTSSGHIVHTLTNGMRQRKKGVITNLPIEYNWVEKVLEKQQGNMTVQTEGFSNGLTHKKEAG